MLDVCFYVFSYVGFSDIMDIRVGLVLLFIAGNLVCDAIKDVSLEVSGNQVTIFMHCLDRMIWNERKSRGIE